ncbi:hypothetical protein JCGZ_20780 [Jatropha curcas]|uniref:Peptidase A1 domain-containing protein n=1 Tax=Jatropha curcas TaxID=180498 RepID=A0A067K1G0_JATCU|nr:hypothetical protein JCGZ_20780 [Jatropha curcas]
MTSSLTLELMLFLAFALTTNTKPQKLVVKLIHTNSIFSPYYNPSESTKDRADRTVKNSNARFKYLQAKVKRNFVVENDDYTYVASLKNVVHGFSVSFLIGQPPVPQLAFMDTGSDLTWIQCRRCINCSSQKVPFYDHTSSSTYKNMPCADRSCESAKCDDDGNCIYEISYLDNTGSRGILGIERLIFETRDEGIVAVDDVVFGCGINNTGTFGLGSGMFGLGYASNSIVNHLGRKFSYCVGDVQDPFYSYNKLKLGKDVDIEGDSTRFELIDNFYFVTLEWISIGQERLDIDFSIFERVEDRGGVIIDSGSELTHLPKAAYAKITNKVFNIINGFLTPTWINVDGFKQLCYYGNIFRNLRGFPTITFHFSGGAELELEVGSIFFKLDEGLSCLAFLPGDSDEQVSIIGILAQQNYNVAYDIDKRRIYFQRIQCELLED